MSTEILSTSMESIALKDVITMQQGLGATALVQNLGPVRPTDWPRTQFVSPGNGDFLNFGGEEGDEHLGDGDSSGNLSDSVRIAAIRSTEGDDFRRDGGEEGDELSSYSDSVRITMGGDNTDGSESYDPFDPKKRSLQLRGGDEGDDDDELSSLSVRITMGGVNGDDTDGGNLGSPGSSDPFKKTEDERRGR